jgi:hypothetical protein
MRRSPCWSYAWLDLNEYQLTVSYCDYQAAPVSIRVVSWLCQHIEMGADIMDYVYCRNRFNRFRSRLSIIKAARKAEDRRYFSINESKIVHRTT